MAVDLVGDDEIVQAVVVEIAYDGRTRGVSARGDGDARSETRKKGEVAGSGVERDQARPAVELPRCRLNGVCADDRQNSRPRVIEEAISQPVEDAHVVGLTIGDDQVRLGVAVYVANQRGHGPLSGLQPRTRP